MRHLLLTDDQAYGTDEVRACLAHWREEHPDFAPEFEGPGAGGVGGRDEGGDDVAARRSRRGTLGAMTPGRPRRHAPRKRNAVIPRP
ncbi:hypothetical protein ABZ802_13735 [Streptomyces sp. NPDC047737]|uniref:hypothetical protein n=1 Tax=unclassified Streptomyces TaxID=2593676 RepID=UPI0033D7C086